MPGRSRSAPPRVSSHDNITLHMVWVGQPAMDAKFFSDHILHSGVLDKPFDERVDLPPDLSGFLSLLESCVKYTSEKVTLHFYCYAEFVEYYNTFIAEFMQRVTARYRADLTEKFVRVYLPKLYKVIAIEVSLAEFSAIHPALGQSTTSYFRFASDRRIRNVRHRVNFRDLFNYVVLFLYGGYVFDANIYALKSRQFTHQQTYFLGHILRPSYDPANLDSLALYPLPDYLDPVLLLPCPSHYPQSQMRIAHPRAVNPASWQVDRFEQISAELFAALRAIPVGTTRFDSARSLLRVFAVYDTDPPNRTHAYKLIDPVHTGLTVQDRSRSLINTSFMYDIFALRARARTPTLLECIDFLVSSLVHLTRRIYADDFRLKAYQYLPVHYFNESIDLVLTAPMVPHLNKIVLTAEPQTIDLRERRSDVELMCCVTPPPVLHMADRLPAPIFYKEDRLPARFFWSAPLMKIFGASHRIKEEYSHVEVIGAEVEAVNAHLGALTLGR